MTGKNFSANNVSNKRKESDFYETPYSLTRLFLDTYTLGFFNGNGYSSHILEPACGNGAIVKVLKEYGYGDRESSVITATDLSQGIDFLTHDFGKQEFNTIITNPPYSLAMEFIKRAKSMSETNGVTEIAMLLPLSYLHGKQRYDEIWCDREFPLSEVYVFTRYPLLGEPLREDGKVHTGMMVYAWFVWTNKYDVFSPSIHWLDNNDFILKKGE
jgi:hypothetical protein